MNSIKYGVSHIAEMQVGTAEPCLQTTEVEKIAGYAVQFRQLPFTFANKGRGWLPGSQGISG